MTDAELKQRMKEYVLNWEVVGEYLKAERHAKVRLTDTATELSRLAPFFNAAVSLHPPSPTSGLVEFYEILGRSRVDEQSRVQPS